VKFPNNMTKARYDRLGVSRKLLPDKGVCDRIADVNIVVRCQFC